MAHYVTCVYCGQTFNRDTEPTVAISARRYAHAQCAKKREKEIQQEEQDYEALEKYIIKLFHKDYVTARIKKQIKDYRQTYNYSFSGMLKTLKWWFDIKGNSIEKANEGIGIIPFIYEQAENYYYSLFLAESVNQNVKDLQPKVQEIEVPPPRCYVSPPKLFDFKIEE